MYTPTLGRRTPASLARVCVQLAFATSFATLVSVSEAQEAAASVPPTAALALLESRCVQCHGGEKTKGGLDLTTRENLLLGGETGPAIVLTRPKESLLYRMVTHEEEPGMPHKEDKLPDADIAQIAAWIRGGVPYERTLVAAPEKTTRAEFTITPADRAHWAFQPVQPVSPPAVKDRAWVRSPIDAFILSRLEAQGLRPSAVASRETLIRRVTFDLIGLPPTPAEVDAFVRDEAPEAYDKLLDRLLASPHYGERWGRHWLDLARFAESDGYEFDTVRTQAWRYRDYVVRAFNTDKPYDRFIREQLAGDQLYPDDPEALTATGFNLLGPDMTDSSDVIQRRRNILNDMTDTASLAFLGLTMGCARCHDHKFEPISHRDYYSLQAFFDSAEFHSELPVATKEEKARHKEAMAIYLELTKDLQDKIKELEGPFRKSVYDRKFNRISAEAQTAHLLPPAQRTPEQQNLVQGTAGLISVKNTEVVAAMTKEDKARHAELLAKLTPIPRPTLPAAQALTEGEPVTSHVLIRGDYASPGEEVTAAFPEILGTQHPAQGSRAALANWLASPTHPLTARVMVNRIWQHHFGRALVPSASDFGTHGQKPTHPELLDWLAGKFVAHGWSLKEMHRLMLRSATYQQSASGSAAAIEHDPENRLYSRMNRLRLEGEAIRDSLLAISGELNPAIGGPGVFPPIPKEIFAGAAGWTPNTDPHEYSRRSLYIFARRNLRFPFLEVFDAPDNNLSCPSRERSTTAPQSLTLLNAEEVLRASDRVARRLEAESASTAVRITAAYREILGRAPTSKERRVSELFLSHSPLHELCRALFNLNAFVYVD